MGFQMKTKAREQSSTSRTKNSPRIGAVIGGNAVEMFDWAIYASFAPFFAQQLFSHEDRSSALLATLAIFAVGFLARPLGGFVFGWVGDRLGRKLALTTSVGLASLGSLIIAVTPTYATAGLWASAILLSARLMQGLAHGGEMPASQTYLSELAPPKDRGLWSSLIYVSGTIGVIGGAVLGVVMTSLLAEEQMLAWGWRIPFLIGGLLGLYTLVMRSTLKESETFDNNGKNNSTGTAGLIAQIVAHRKQALQVIGLTIGITVGYYTWAVAMPSLAISYHGISANTALWAGVVGNVVFLLSLPLWGLLSDKIGRKPVLVISLGGSALLQVPLSSMFQGEAWQLFVSMCIMLMVLAGMLSIMPATFAELFPTSIRTVGVAVPYSICVALFGGTAPYVNAWLTANAGSLAFPVYASILLLVSCALVATITETKGLVLTKLDKQAGMSTTA